MSNAYILSFSMHFFYEWCKKAPPGQQPWRGGRLPINLKSNFLRHLASFCFPPAGAAGKFLDKRKMLYKRFSKGTGVLAGIERGSESFDFWAKGISEWAQPHKIVFYIMHCAVPKRRSPWRASQVSLRQLKLLCGEACCIMALRQT